MKNALQSRGASSKKFLAGTKGRYDRKSDASSSKSQLHQEQLFVEAGDRPEAHPSRWILEEAGKINRQTIRRLDELEEILEAKLAKVERASR